MKAKALCKCSGPCKCCSIRFLEAERCRRTLTSPRHPPGSKWPLCLLPPSPCPGALRRCQHRAVSRPASLGAAILPAATPAPGRFIGRLALDLGQGALLWVPREKFQLGRRKQGLSAGDDFVPQGTFGSFWRHFCLSRPGVEWGGVRELLASSGSRPGMLRNFLPGARDKELPSPKCAWC